MSWSRPARKLTALAALLTLLATSSQAASLRGRVLQQDTTTPLPASVVRLAALERYTVTDEEGWFELPGLTQGSYTVIVRRLGFRSESLVLRTGQIAAIELEPTVLEFEQVVLTVGDAAQPRANSPGAVGVIGPDRLAGMGGLRIDDKLGAEPGIFVRREGGIFTMEPQLQLRPLGGLEPGRTQVLLDGVPMERGDSGNPNWNLLSALAPTRAEILHGAASALHGGGAMGGVIELSGPPPSEGAKTTLSLRGGSYGTLGGDASFGYGQRLGQQALLHLRLDGHRLSSEGYVGTPEADRDEYTVKRDLSETALRARASLHWAGQSLALGTFRYRDQRGEGERIQAPSGEYRSFDSDGLDLHYGGVAGATSWQLIGWGRRENYERIDERLRGGQYQRFDVLSVRDDAGGHGRLAWRSEGFGTLSLGLDGRASAVDAVDLYRTSPDSVANSGRRASLGLTLAEQIDLAPRTVLTAALRMDQIRFMDGSIVSTLPPWDGYAGPLEEQSWFALSPRIGLAWRSEKQLRLFGSVGRAFRAASLDDLTRSGFTRAGPKLANPALAPEYLTSLDLGVETPLAGGFLSLTGFAALGQEYHEYVDTGIEIFGGRFSLLQKQNVARVLVMGIELGTRTVLGAGFSLQTALMAGRSRITAFPQRPELEGERLVLTPELHGRATLVFAGPLDAELTWEGVGPQLFSERMQRRELAGYGLLHLRLAREIAGGLHAELDLRNLADRQQLAAPYQLDPGRMILIGLGYRLR